MKLLAFNQLLGMFHSECDKTPIDSGVQSKDTLAHLTLSGLKTGGEIRVQRYTQNAPVKPRMESAQLLLQPV